MRFLIDAHLPPSLCRIIESFGHEAIHTSSLPEGNATPDASISSFSQDRGWIVVTKDSDFYFSHILEGRPEKLLLLRIGNMRLRALLDLFQRHLPEIISSFSANSLVEMHVDHINH